ncbi:ATP-dependent nuclease [Methanococcoides seepicolus]|uniref:AAA family ATPase n=1 Tax=Methanococcoides seepicolus TaxID=2828780 RepID=A0A9E5DAK0_9EURY|nr:AAA family ATPase [Methanococcoides seepicolus]MCM1985543.1 AAA family ATPase [Methanococcoides seepicolus]
MKINKISIKQFRGFNDVEFHLGSRLTVIAGQNGTQKTTLLGMLSQPFSIPDKEHPLSGEKPLCGGRFKSGFAEKFKLSATFDKPKKHEWTLYFDQDDFPEYTVESIRRSKAPGDIRFWKKGDRSKGSGYVQKPVIYLSLSRLFPIGEDSNLDSSNDIELTEEEFKFYEEWHNKILIIPDVKIESANYLASHQKNTLGANTSFYDWKMNSAGQDNIGKILLAILSFKRLMGREGYAGGILAIDELDATLYPASQLKLLAALRKFASKYDIQILFTTHSLPILEEACKLNSDEKISGQINVVYLEKRDNNIIPIENLQFESINNRLHVIAGKATKKSKITVYCEDDEARIFLKSLLKNKRNKKLNYVDVTFGCENLKELARKKVPCFSYPQSLIILDGDASLKGVKAKNILRLPGSESPERLLAKYLFNLSDSDNFWAEIGSDYTKQFVFKDISYNDISDREKAKQWYGMQKSYWGRNSAKLINKWMEDNQEVESFLNEFDETLLRYEHELGIVLG